METRTADLVDRAQGGSGERLGSERARHVVFTFDDVTWDAAQRRGMCFSQDRLLMALLEDPAVERLLVCNRPRNAAVKLVKDIVRPPIPFERREGAWLREPVRIRQHDPVSISALKRSYATYGRRLRRAARRHGLERPAIVTSQPFVAGFADLEWAGPVTLYATDDLAAHPSYRRWEPGLLAAYQEIAQRRRRVCAVSTAIVERIDPLGPAKVVPNGVDAGMWLRPDDPPRWLSDLPGPRLLYIGTLDSRIDAEAVRSIARAWPQGSVVLVGPLADRPHLAALLAEPNVVLHGPVSRDTVAALAHGVDACLLPHHRTRLTEAMSPLKLYEYLAAGRPAVATDLEPVRRVDGPVFRVPPGGDYVAALREALAHGPVDEEERLRLVAANSWASRSAEVASFVLAT